jgi:hypothetical protein
MRFTAQDGLALESRLVNRENLQFMLLDQEMRPMTITVTERLLRLETQFNAMQAQPH